MPGLIQVNLYRHHIGDYDSATAHLSWDEDQAYTRLLRLYYRLERPLPTDTGEACRLVRAKTSTHRQAVEVILREFFDLRDDGWHNKRADEEIASYRRQVTHNREVGTLGGRPRKPGNNPSGLGVETKVVSGNNPNQEPRTKNQERAEATRGSRLSPEWLPSELLKAWAAKERPDLDLEVIVAKFRDYWAAKPGKAGLKLDWEATFRNWVREEKAGRAQPQKIKVDL
jgi:uncharacterized protein YdaU (DUF1376 family)